MDGVPAFELSIFLLATFAAALVAGLAGFAFGLIAAATWLHVLSPSDTAALIVGFGLFAPGVAVWKLRRARPAPAVAVSRRQRARRSGRRCGAGVGAAGSVAGGDRCAAGGLQPLCPGSTCSARPARTNRDLPEKNLSSRDICSSAFCRALGRVLFVSSQRPSPDLAAPDLAALQLLWAGGGPLEPHLRGLFALMHCQRWTL